MTIERKVIEKVMEFIEEEKAFTSFDVTLALQADGVDELHQDIRHLVPKMFRYAHFPDDYERTNIEVGDEGATAWLYHPDHFDASTYPLEEELAVTKYKIKVRDLYMLGIPRLNAECIVYKEEIDQNPEFFDRKGIVIFKISHGVYNVYYKVEYNYPIESPYSVWFKGMENSETTEVEVDRFADENNTQSWKEAFEIKGVL